MISFANKNDRIELSSLWQRVFLEDKEVCDCFFEDIFASTVTPIIRIDNKIAASLFLLDCNIGSYRGKCVYCAMTDYPHRGKGYMRELLDFSYNYCIENGFDFLILVPAEKSLFDYYAKCGFEAFGVRNTYTVGEEIPQSSNALKYDYSLNFSESIIEYWQKSCVHYGGEVTDFGLIFNDDNVIIRNAKGDFNNIPHKYKIDGTVIQGDITFGETECPAMIRTENKNIKNTSCYVGNTLE